jgi:hypothetical protein
MTHAAFITSLTRTVRDLGAAGALADLRASRADIAGQPYHETLAVYYVWAVDRLIEGGLSDLALLWHPLLDEASVYAWYPVEVLASDDAAERFLASPMALADEPQPQLPRHAVAA